MISKKLVLIIGILFIISGNLTIKADSTKYLAKTEILGEEYFVYESKKGESAYAIAHKYGWNYNEFIKLNPEAQGILKKGTKLYYPTGENTQKTVNLPIDNDEPIRHIVKRGETVYSLSREYGTPLEVIYRLNPGAIKGVKAGDVIEIPREEQTQEDIPTQEILPNREDLYTSQLQTEEIIISEEVPDTVKIEKEFNGVRMALILDDPGSKKDVDFTRGMLIALSGMKDAKYKVDLKVLDGRVASTELIQELDAYEPNIIVTTADKAFPAFLADYGNSNNVQVVNVFDLKNDLYEDNSSLVQILIPSQQFNNQISKYIYNEHSNRKLLNIGEPDKNDGLSSELSKLYGENIETMTLEEFGGMEPDIMQPVVIYSYATRKEDVADFLNNVENISDNNPGFDFSVIGRSNWITYIDDFGDKFEEYSVLIPARVWLDEESEQWKEFTNEYEILFDGYPTRSIPNFAASGYDIAEFFIPAVTMNQGDFTTGKNESSTIMLQTDFNLARENKDGGLINGVSYIVKFSPYKKKEKVRVN